MSKALDRKDAEEFVNHYLRYLYQQLHGYDFVKNKDTELNKLMKQTYS